MKELIEKAEVLQEALPYIRRFRGSRFVIKYGGHAMVDADLKRSFARDVALLRYVGLSPVVVHGGGPQIGEMLDRLGIQTRFVDGQRVTDEETMRVVEMVLGGGVNQELVGLICEHGGRAVGLSGQDDRFIVARRVEAAVDLGRVGEPTEVRPDVIERLLAGDFLPVIAPIGVDADGGPLNINADTVASKVAQALRAEKLILMTDTAGVRAADGRLLGSLDTARAQALIADGTISGGMIPKVRFALDAVANGVGKVHIVDGRTRHAVLLEIFTDQGIGTEVVE
ncbi:MAG: acetylglutamate kinase [Deltaproteobacteria bacterium]|nr:acetylglutamate kinase [Deltaproteobacteria bacterium]